MSLEKYVGKIVYVKNAAPGTVVNAGGLVEKIVDTKSGEMLLVSFDHSTGYAPTSSPVYESVVDYIHYSPGELLNEAKKPLA